MGSEKTKDDWHCKTCKGKDGKPHKNFGFRSYYLRCGEGVCVGSKVAHKDGPSTLARQALAEKQVHLQQQEELRKKAANVAELEANLKRQENELLAARHVVEEC